MNIHSLRSFLAALLLASGAALLSACGGGGAGTNPGQGGAVNIVATVGTLYGGIPATFLLQGGRGPYSLSSSEPGLLPIPSVVAGQSVTVVPNNPGVVDADLDPDELPVRTVTVFIRDTTGLSASARVQVAQNFLTGYGVIFTPVVCPGDAGEAPQACSGGTSAVRLQATFNGNLAGNRQFRFEVLRGNFALRNPETGQVSSSVVLRSDHTGTVLGLIEVPAGVATHIAVLRVIDVPTGVYADHVFVISQTVPGESLITAIPDSFTFTGPLTTICGTGRGTFFVFDGVPPYTAVSSNPNVLVTPTVSNSQPGVFTVEAFNPDTCVTDAIIVVTDSVGGRDTVTVTTERGDEAPTPPPPPPDFSVGPTSLTLGCGQSGSVTAVGGSGNFSANSTNPEVTAAVSGNTVTITRAGPAGPGAGTLNATVSVTDGASIETVAVTSPATCP